MLTKDILNQLTLNAMESSRLRMNYNLHETTLDRAQRLFNALEPGTKVPIHRHRDTVETIVMLRGSLVIKFFDDRCEELERHVLRANSDIFGVNVPIGIWHDVDVLESGTILLEIKEGPYSPLTIIDILNR